VVGIGPGGPLDRTLRAEKVIGQSSIVVGYARYLELIKDLTPGKEIISSGMRQEKERCLIALRRAQEGHSVSLISSGDPGIYGMAGLALEISAAEGMDVPIEIVPGVSASNAAAARLGAPIMLDYASISLSDLLVPWETILKRLTAVAQADLVAVLYNPKSKKRIRQLEEAVDIFKGFRPETTPVGIATAIGTEEEQFVLTDLDHCLGFDISMRSVLIVGNKSSVNLKGWFITPRGYAL
jgi:precorrin-3B C17-methyltransferase / cobalt-factor III methyltransferase